MMRLISSEWRRFRHDRGNMVIVLVTAVILLLSGVMASFDAKARRTEENTQKSAHTALVERITGGLIADDKPIKIQPFNINRQAGANVKLALGEGLVLGSSRFDSLTSDTRVGIESRHVDGRRDGGLSNPYLASLGALDHGVLVAILLPLALFSLSFGLVNEEREQGIWRFVVSQVDNEWRILAAALLIRILTLTAIEAIAAALALSIDTGGKLSVLTTWLPDVFGYALFWGAVAALLILLTRSSSATMVAMLGTWIIGIFIIPTMVGELAKAENPMPSRLATLVEMRAIQQDAEDHAEELLTQWYKEHSLPEPATEWPVSTVPRYLSQDNQYRPLAYQFDIARTNQWNWMSKWYWLLPNIALLGRAESLAGISASDYQGYVSRVNQYEDAWRAMFVPKIMRFEALTRKEFLSLPSVTYSPQSASDSSRARMTAPAYLSAFLLLAIAFLLRRRLSPAAD
ncbi:DUF3526 domain-containing protein [Herbaspirillum sp. alder98]|uniref:DUF3526 domain-containing protein n=1 Tax=Herbaspirillum sp. alder98 TaxID=2913096 RepID=UPI001CD86C4A|nr:DUF3526 domain-containing protein [Herbaspirillum sp. alder98]MCA1323571.1 DUF3526 domain-containing protein [Herbaspirillum sp. alder98]